MTQAYSDPTRENDPHALPDIEVFQVDETEAKHNARHNREYDDGSPEQPGWYWWACFPGCLPDGDPIGPFDTEAEALADARDQ